MNDLLSEYEKREHVETAVKELKKMGFIAKNAILFVNKRGYYYIKNKYVINKKLRDDLSGSDLYV